MGSPRWQRHPGSLSRRPSKRQRRRHRRNLLDPRFTSLGAGVAVGTFDHRYQVLWVLDLARIEP